MQPELGLDMLPLPGVAGGLLQADTPFWATCLGMHLWGSQVRPQVSRALLWSKCLSPGFRGDPTRSRLGGACCPPHPTLLLPLPKPEGTVRLRWEGHAAKGAYRSLYSNSK